MGLSRDRWALVAVLGGCTPDALTVVENADSTGVVVASSTNRGDAATAAATATSTSGPASAGTTGSSGDASASAGSGSTTAAAACAPSPEDVACATCIKEVCCDELQVCLADEACSCVYDCGLEMGGAGGFEGAMMCAEECDADVQTLGTPTGDWAACWLQNCPACI